MNALRYRFSLTFLFVVMFFITCVAAFVVSFGRHAIWASTHIIVRNYPALTRETPMLLEIDEAMCVCQFDNLTFLLPESLAGNAKVVRSGTSDVFVLFEDAKRQMQIPLTEANLRTRIGKIPKVLDKKSIPQLLETMVTSSTDQFSFSMPRRQLAIHDWAISHREVLGIDSQSFDRFLRHSGNRADVFTVSAHPSSIDSKQRIRTYLAWESFEHNQSGSIWFGDASTNHVSWIEAVTLSVDLTAPIEKMVPVRNYAAMPDSEILGLFKITTPLKKK